MDNEIVKRLIWTGLLAGTGALASIVAMRVSAADLAAASSTRIRPSDASPRRAPRPGPGDDRSVGELVFDVSERVSTLVREEIELAKTEVTEKVTKLLRGSVGRRSPPGVFAFLGLILLMHGYRLAAQRRSSSATTSGPAS